MKAIAFTGLARSGKDLAADYLAEKYGFAKVVMSDVLAEELAKQGKEDIKINRSHMGKEMRKKFGNDVVAKKVLEKAREKGFEKVVFVGPRSVSEIEFFRKELPGFMLIAVKSDEEKRFERRSLAQGETRERFRERDEHDSTEFEVDKVIKLADSTMDNNSTIDDFKKAIDGLMQKI